MLVKSLTSACKFPDSRTYDLTLSASFSGGEMELLQWLDNYTFPTEVRFKDVRYAKRAYSDVVRRIVNSGVSDQFICPIIILMLNYQHHELDNDMLLLR